MRNKLSRRTVIEKCIIVFEALRRHASKGNAGLIPEKGAEEEYYMDDEICQELRKILREMEAGEKKRAEEQEEKKITPLRDCQQDIIENGTPERLVF